MTWKEGDRYICKECNVEVHVEKKTYQGIEKLSHRNADGSAHFDYEELTRSILHTPTRNTETDLHFMEIEDRLARIERQLGIVIID